MEKSLEEIDRLLEKLQVEADGCNTPKRFGSPSSQVDCTTESKSPDHKKLKKLISKDQENNQVPKIVAIDDSKCRNKDFKENFNPAKNPGNFPSTSTPLHLPDRNNNANSSHRTGKHKNLQHFEHGNGVTSPELALKGPIAVVPKSPSRHTREDDRKKISFPSVVRVLTTVNNVLISKHADDLNLVWNSVKPDKIGGKHTVALETVIKENFHLVFKNCLKHLKDLKLDEKESFPGWQSAKNVLNVTWILSDSSLIFSQQIVWDDETLQLLYFVFKTYVNHDQFEEDKTLKYCVKAFLGILHNICRHCFEAKEYLRKFPFLSALLKLSKTRISMIKAKCLIVMSYVVNDSEIHIVSTDSQVLVFIINILKDAKKSEDHMSYKYGMNVMEILHGINNLLANDENKEKLLSLEILEEYLELLALKFTDEEVYLTVLGLWKLSFHRSNKDKMRASQALLQELTKLQDSLHEDLKHAARGALWEIGQNVPSPDIASRSVWFVNLSFCFLHLKEADCPHIMISYQWDSQPVMLKVKDRLKDAGYKVWMDVEHMTGSTLEAMALAVEKASVVLIGMTQKYKDSPACRSEAEYTYKLRKSFIPLRLQHRYVPDGWLGMLIGTRLYFDISSDDKIEQQMTNLMKELGSRGKIGTDNVDGLCIASLPQRISYEEWTTDEVLTWLSDNFITGIPVQIMKTLDGQLLKELKTIQENAPEYFYHLLQTDFKLDVTGLLRFSRMLRGLRK